MRIQDYLLEVNTRLHDNPRTMKSNKPSDSDKQTISFAEHLNSCLQADTAVVQQSMGSQNVATMWLQYYMPKPWEKIKSSAYLPLSEL